MEYQAFNERVYSPQTRAQKFLADFCDVMLAIYISMVVILYNFANAAPNFIISVICGALIFIAAYRAVKLFLPKLRALEVSRNAERGKLCRKLFAVSSAALFIIFIIDLLAYYPGGISPDNISQWEQAQAGAYTDWYPAIHTMIIWLITRVYPSYAFLVGFQILCFSLLSGYMAATLAAWGIKRGFIIAFIVMLAATRTNGEILLFAWKDSAFSVLLLCLTVFMINIVLSDGGWLSKHRNAAAFAVITALCSIIRHNGFFFTVPMAALIIILYTKKTVNAIFTVAASILIVAGVKFIIYPAAGVQYVPSQTYVESVGLPMTVLGGVMSNNPKALDAETNEFLNRITDYETWKSTFKSGDFTTIKYVMPTTDVILSVSPGELISMTLRTMWRAPKEAVLEIIALTRIVWSPLDWDYGIEVYMEESARGDMISENELVRMRQASLTGGQLHKNIRAALEMLTPSRILTSIGLHVLLLILAGVYSANYNLGKRALLLFVPGAIYNLGTMLLLFGPEYRLFHFNAVISLPLIIALTAKQPADEYHDEHLVANEPS